MKLGTSFALAIFALGASAAHADATLEYTLNDGGSGTTSKKISIARFFSRVDSSDKPDEYLLFQAGKFFPLYHVNAADKTYRLLTPPVDPSLSRGTRADEAAPVQAEQKTEAVAAEAPQTPAESDAPAAGAATEAKHAHAGAAATENPGAAKPAPKDAPTTPVFKPSSKTDEVAGVKCRVVIELVDGEPAIEHCMANKAALRITERESRTLARVFMMAREQGYGWLGAATKDEDFISVRSRTLGGNKALQLVSLSTKPLEQGYLKVPTDFTEAKESPQPSQDPKPSSERPPQSAPPSGE